MNHHILCLSVTALKKTLWAYQWSGNVYQKLENTSLEMLAAWVPTVQLLKWSLRLWFLRLAADGLLGHLFQNSFLFAVFRVGPRILNISQISYQVVLHCYSWDTVEQLTQITETKLRVKHGLSWPPNNRNRRRRQNLEARYAYLPFGRELMGFISLPQP